MEKHCARRLGILMHIWLIMSGFSKTGQSVFLTRHKFIAGAFS